MTCYVRMIFTMLCFLTLALSGCGGKRVPAVEPVSPYAGYECPRLFEEMGHKIGQAKMLFVNVEDEDTAGKLGKGALTGAAGAAMASGLILTPLGWLLAGGLMVSGASKMIDGIAHEDLSDNEKRVLVNYKKEYDEMREIALQKKCDYYQIPRWDVEKK